MGFELHSHTLVIKGGLSINARKNTDYRYNRSKGSNKVIEFWQKLKVNYKTIFEVRKATQFL